MYRSQIYSKIFHNYIKKNQKNLNPYLLYPLSQNDRVYWVYRFVCNILKYSTKITKCIHNLGLGKILSRSSDVRRPVY